LLVPELELETSLESSFESWAPPNMSMGIGSRFFVSVYSPLNLVRSPSIKLL